MADDSGSWEKSQKDVMASEEYTPRRKALGEIWQLAWPQIVMMIFHFLIGFADVYVAGRISSNVQASMGMVNQLLFFFLVVAIAVANGSVAAISQSMGAGLKKRVRRYVGLVLEVGVVMSAVILLVGLAGIDIFMKMLQVPTELVPIVDYFFQIFLVILPFYYLFIITNAIYRAQKMVMYPLYAMVLTTVANTFGDFAFGLGWFGFPELGYKGLAWSTFVSIVAGMGLNVYILWRKGLLRVDSFPPLRWSRKAFPYLYKVAWPGGLTQIIWQSAYVLLFSIVASLPETNIVALGGMTAGLRVESFLFLPGVAFNMTASIIVGQYVGEGRPATARKMGYLILGSAIIGIGLLTLLTWQVLEPVCRFIAPDPAVSAEAVNYMVYNMLAIPFTLTTMILSGALNGAGATLLNLWTFIIGVWMVRLPLAWALGHFFGYGATGVWVAMLVSQGCQAAVVLYVFQFTDWSRFAMRAGRNGRKRK